MIFIKIASSGNCFEIFVESFADFDAFKIEVSILEFFSFSIILTFCPPFLFCMWMFTSDFSTIELCYILTFKVIISVFWRLVFGVVN